MLSAPEPERDWTFLSHAYRHLRRTAAPSRDKLSRMVAALDLDLGLRDEALGILRGLIERVVIHWADDGRQVEIVARW